MRAVLQRVTHASVKVDGETIGEIGNGFLILLGVAEEDNEAAADKMADKICKLRIFQDGDGKTNLSLADVAGENFWLLASLPCMQTAIREIAPALLRREVRKKRTGCMSIL